MYFGPDEAGWKLIKPEFPAGAPDPEKAGITADAYKAKEELKTTLLASLQMQHLVVLAGSGTSLGSVTKGPSMRDLWDYCVNSNPGTGKDARTLTPLATKIITEVGYDSKAEKENIESLLSRCEALLQVKPTKDVSDFVTGSKQVILGMCSKFLDPADENQLAAHRTFLHRLSRRRVRDSRLKLFTTNYDLCFENAAGRQGLVALDGFSFTQPRHFDPRFFEYDIVRRPHTGEEIGTPLEGVFHLYKLHGSVNWSRNDDGEISMDPSPTPERACLIYPAKGKYQQSYLQPHLELISRYFSGPREPNTCLLVVGFGFNDDHLAEPILSAVQTNPHLRIIIVNPLAHDLTARPKENKYWDALFNLSKRGEDVWLINAGFADFAELIPDLKSLTPAQRLARDIKTLANPK
jgi:SIR2-like domain